MPPSAMTGTSCSAAAWAHSQMAVTWGTPAPVTTRVVQIDPGADADLDGVGAALDQGERALGRGHVAAR